jgi:hypothetical protein
LHPEDGLVCHGRIDKALARAKKTAASAAAD